jgi:hypothetical protein
MPLADVLVESTKTASLSLEAKRVVLDDEPYPIEIRDASALRKKISAAQAKVGRRPGARGGGNQTKRLRLVLQPTGLSKVALSRILERGKG